MKTKRFFLPILLALALCVATLGPSPDAGAEGISAGSGGISGGSVSLTTTQTISGKKTFTADITLNDNVQLCFGTDCDHAIDFDGANLTVGGGTGGVVFGDSVSISSPHTFSLQSRGQITQGVVDAGNSQYKSLLGKGIEIFPDAAAGLVVLNGGDAHLMGGTLSGDNASGGDLTLESTTHATKGKILFGTSAYDEVNNRLGIGTTTPAQPLSVEGVGMFGAPDVSETLLGMSVNTAGHEGVSLYHDGVEAFLTSVDSSVSWHDLTIEALAVRFDLNGSPDKVVFTSAASTFGNDVVLNNATTIVDGAIAFDRTNEDLSVGDGLASRVVHMGAWKTWTPVFSGFSADPTVNAARYTQVGKLVIVHLSLNNGTSNATTFTITLPVAAANTAKQHIPMAVATNNGTSTVGGGLMTTRTNSATADLYKDNALGVWTNVGAKKVQGMFTYETN